MNVDIQVQNLRLRNHRKSGKLPVWALILCSAFIILHSSSPAYANPSADDVFKSMQTSSHGDSMDGSKVIGFLAVIAGIAVLVVAINRLQKTEPVSKTLNHQGKLMRELMKSAGLKSSQIRQLKSLRDDLDNKGTPVENLVTLLLCPSLIQKAREPERAKKRV